MCSTEVVIFSPPVVALVAPRIVYVYVATPLSSNFNAGEDGALGSPSVGNPNSRSWSDGMVSGARKTYHVRLSSIVIRVGVTPAVEGAVHAVRACSSHHKHNSSVIFCMLGVDCVADETVGYVVVLFQQLLLCILVL